MATICIFSPSKPFSILPIFKPFHMQINVFVAEMSQKTKQSERDNRSILQRILDGLFHTQHEISTQNYPTKAKKGKSKLESKTIRLNWGTYLELNDKNQGTQTRTRQQTADSLRKDLNKKSITTTTKNRTTSKCNEIAWLEFYECHFVIVCVRLRVRRFYVCVCVFLRITISLYRLGLRKGNNKRLQTMFHCFTAHNVTSATMILRLTDSAVPGYAIRI